MKTMNRQVTRITKGDGHYFFGYYDKSPWDVTGRWMLGMRSRFMDRPPEKEDVLEIGLIDTQNEYAWTSFAESRAWSWQQGCMLQWLGGSENKVIFNDREGDRFVSRIVQPWTGEVRTLNRPVYSVDSQGRYGISLNFSRLQHQRPGYGYPGIEDPWRYENEPKEDGLFYLNLHTGESRLLIRTFDIAHFERTDEFNNKIHRVNHVQVNREGSRFAFLHRYQKEGVPGHRTRLLTMDAQGGGLRCISDHEMVSHYDWNHQGEILAWARRKGIGDRYFLFTGEGEPQVIGEETFNDDGHCTFSPDDQWMLTDTYPDSRDHRSLMLYHFKTKERIDLGSFYSMRPVNELRCDLHPRWSRDGKKICIDSTHEGSRQMYIVDTPL